MRHFALVVCSLVAFVLLLLGAASYFTYISYRFGTPHTLPVVIIECGEGYISVWHVTGSKQVVPTSDTKMFDWWLFGGQRVVAPLMLYTRARNQFVIHWADSPNFEPRWTSPDVITNGRAIVVKIAVMKLFVLFAAWPAINFIRGSLRRSRRRRDGACVHCGYSLTGNTSGVCPECGTHKTFWSHNRR